MKKIIIVLISIIIISGCSTAPRKITCTRKEEFASGDTVQTMTGLFKNNYLDTYTMQADYSFIESDEAKRVYEEMLKLKDEYSNNTMGIDIILNENIMTIIVKYNIDNLNKMIDENDTFVYSKEKTADSFLSSMKDDGYSCTED